MLQEIARMRTTDGRSNHESIDCARSIYNTRNLLLSAVCLALVQSILFSFRSIDEIQSKQQIIRDTPTFTTDMLREGSQRQLRDQKLPHWRLGTDCSLYSFDCFAVAVREDKYMPYPFSLSARKEIESSGNSGETSTKKEEDWSVEIIDELPAEWVEYLGKNETKGKIPDRNYLYPPKVPDEEYQSCINLAIKQNKTTIEQLDILFSGDSPQIVPEPDTNMMAFTISDYAYVQEMIHDMFQMMDDIVGFSNKHFFLVALDEKSAELACRYGYSVVMWKADDNLRDAVANTKMILSYELVKRGISFFFTEMDVWWIRSPKQHLIDFQKDPIGRHIYFSGHQNNYDSPNIGVYAVTADEYTEEYFRICLDVLKEKPETHDQYIMQVVDILFRQGYEGKTIKFFDSKQWKPEGVPKVPEIKHHFLSLRFSPHEVVADERPTTTHKTLAIHTLNNLPLQAPHGKKMNAKELGVYYGFRSFPKGSPGADPIVGGYYERSGEKRRYLWLDTDTRTNFYSHSDSNHYHYNQALEWTMAILIAIARKTNRILVLPQIFNAAMDAGTYFVWPIMDYSKVTEMVDFRETNFLSNPKAWKSDGFGADHWPFESVVNTALFEAVDDRKKISIYTQVSDRSSIVSKKVWKSTADDRKWLEAWIGSLSVVPEIDSAEVLLVNPDLLMEKGRIDAYAHRLKRLQKINDPIGPMDREVLEIYDLLGWCWRTQGFRHTANKVSASDSCYGTGH
mmetsp:Transcript_22275/g.55171  ORF Transcript_22275/g.55171 Transcript_22275/m.55171 type:complete len:736 (-) Transcript_22275:55-2262(-)